MIGRELDVDCVVYLDCVAPAGGFWLEEVHVRNIRHALPYIPTVHPRPLLRGLLVECLHRRQCPPEEFLRDAVVDHLEEPHGARRQPDLLHHATVGISCTDPGSAPRLRSARVSGGWTKKGGMVLIPESIKPLTPTLVSSNSFTALARSYGAAAETTVDTGDGNDIGKGMVFVCGCKLVELLPKWESAVFVTSHNK